MLPLSQPDCHSSSSLKHRRNKIQHRQYAILSRSYWKFSKCYFLITLSISQNVFIAFIRLKRCEKTESTGLSFKAVHPLELLHTPGSGCIKLNTLSAEQSLVSNVMMKGCAFVSLALNLSLNNFALLGLTLCLSVLLSKLKFKILFLLKMCFL